ncbi:unnamed protein product, partial [marine sediment metagenome]
LLIQKFPEITSMQINDYHWLISGKIPDSKPHHRTRDIAF